MGVFMMAKVYSIIIGNTIKPTDDTYPSALAKPIVINNQTSAVNIPKLQAMWTQYQVVMMGYSHLIGKYNCKLLSWTDANSQAMGILNQALDIGIWDQIKEKTAKESELFTLLHLFLPDSYWTPRILLDWTRTGTNFMLADHHTNFVSQS